MIMSPSQLVTALKRIQELSFKAGISKDEKELRDWNVEIHKEATEALKPFEENGSEMDIVIKYTTSKEK